MAPAIQSDQEPFLATSSGVTPSSSRMSAIKAVEKHGRKNDAYRLIGASRDLPQSEDTIAWVIDELNDEWCGKHENYAYNLSIVLVNADPTLLLPRESDILEARHFLADLRTPLTDRLRMLSRDEAGCWRNLEEFCEEGAHLLSAGPARRWIEFWATFPARRPATNAREV